MVNLTPFMVLLTRYLWYIEPTTYVISNYELQNITHKTWLSNTNATINRFHIVFWTPEKFTRGSIYHMYFNPWVIFSLFYFEPHHCKLNPIISAKLGVRYNMGRGFDISWLGPFSFVHCIVCPSIHLFCIFKSVYKYIIYDRARWAM
jgi:hypothetical protein